jgi:translation initiation factor 1
MTGGPGYRTVYSTDPDWVPPCEVCGLPPADCLCPSRASSSRQPPAAGRQPVVRLRLEKKGRGGKAVTVVEGLSGSPASIEETARALKEACGTGGTVKKGTIELQGDQRTRAAAALSFRGYQVRVAGG